MELCVDRVQGDPYAAPSRVRLRVPTELGGLWADADARDAAEDALLRRFVHELAPARKRGSGRSGALQVYRPGPEIVERSTLRLFRDGTVELRLAVGLPARGRRILGRQAAELLLDDLPAAGRAVQLEPDEPRLVRHIASVKRQRALRRALPEHGLVAFVADGSVLPRASGVSQRPLPSAVPVRAPDRLAITLPTPDGPVRGLGIRQGVTLIVGGGFHGKSTLLQALQRGHLDHVPGDGREQVVCRPDAVKVRAEDGRRIEGVDISAFLDGLPGDRDTTAFRTDDASGSTSQAANLVEALEAGARVLLLDEDTSATNLLVSDERMRRLVGSEHEPITPLVQRVRQLADQGVSTVMVVGGVADYLAVADQVVAMRHYEPHDVSEAAAELAGEVPRAPGPMEEPGARVPRNEGLAAGKIRARDTRAVQYDKGLEIDLTAVEQVIDASQAFTLGHAVRFVAEHLVDGRRSLPVLLDALDAILDDEGVEVLSPWPAPPGDLVRPRRFEIAAALSRHRRLRVD
jgi:predicted ABC-class ATPase